MNTLPDTPFGKLPLTPDQVREIEHYIYVRVRSGVPWDTPELAMMLHDMLDPPENAPEDPAGLQQSLAAEWAVAANEESDQIDLLKSERDHNH